VSQDIEHLLYRFILLNAKIQEQSRDRSFLPILMYRRDVFTSAIPVAQI